MPELDLIVGGDTHTRLNMPSRIARANGNGSVAIVQARHYYQFLGRVDVQLQKATRGYRVMGLNGKLLPLDGAIARDSEIEALINEYTRPLGEVICRTERDLPNARDEHRHWRWGGGLHQTRAMSILETQRDYARLLLRAIFF